MSRHGVPSQWKRGRVECGQACFERCQGSRRDPVGLGENQAIRHRRLASGFGMAFELLLTQQRVHRSHHGVHLEARGDPAVLAQGAYD
jgi:hypothetical protein